MKLPEPPTPSSATAVVARDTSRLIAPHSPPPVPLALLVEKLATLAASPVTSLRTVVSLLLPAAALQVVCDAGGAMDLTSKSHPSLTLCSSK